MKMGESALDNTEDRIREYEKKVAAFHNAVDNILTQCNPCLLCVKPTYKIIVNNEKDIDIKSVPSLDILRTHKDSIYKDECKKYCTAYIEFIKMISDVKKSFGLEDKEE